MSTILYNTEILRLAASLGDQPRLSHPDTTVELRSPTCGSRVIVDLVLDGDVIAAFGQETRACALGQASMALLGASIVGRDARAIEDAREALRAFLAGGRDDPGSWPGLALFSPARPHRARHASIMLAFDAAGEALARMKA